MSFKKQRSKMSPHRLANNRLRGPVTALMIALLSISTTQAADYKPAELTEAVAAKHPYASSNSDMSRRSHNNADPDSGVVELVYVIDANGAPQEIEIVRSSLPYFEGEAIRTVSKYKHTPATLNTKPVDSRGLARVEFDHSKISTRKSVGFADPMDATDDYMGLYNKVRKELAKESPNQEKAARYLRKIEKLPYKTYFTGVHTALAENQFASLFGSKEEQLEPLLNIMMYQDVVWSGKPALDEKTKSTIKLSIVKLLIEIGHYAEALARYEEYATENKEIVDSFTTYIKKISDYQQSDAVYERKIEILDRGTEFATLLKRTFTLEILEGQVDSFALRCDSKYAKFDFSKDAQYQLPEPWGRCEIQLNGEPGSVVSILQQ